MSADKMREEFEAWVLSLYPNQSLDRFNPLHGVTEGEYMGFTVQHCWEAWKASRESLVIELPSTQCINLNEYTSCEAVGACKRAIEAAGLKVKS